MFEINVRRAIADGGAVEIAQPLGPVDVLVRISFSNADLVYSRTKPSVSLWLWDRMQLYLE